MSKPSISKLSLNEIDNFISLLDNSVNGRDNRIHKRVNAKIPFEFMMKSATGEFKPDIQLSSSGCFIVDLSKGGAGILCPTILKAGQTIHIKGTGKDKVFVASLVIKNARKRDGSFHYGCTIGLMQMLKA